MKNKTIGLLIIISLVIFFLWLYKVDFSLNNSTLIPPNTISPTIIDKIPYLPTTPLLEQIFSDNHNWTATLSAERIRVLLATGDVIPARSVNYQATKLNNFKWAFEKTADVLKTADITLINLESPLVKKCPLTNEGMKFCGDQRNVEGLTHAGVDVVSLANNHMGNYGADGIENTIKVLGAANILPTGISGPIFKDVQGLNFAFLGYSDVDRPEKMLSWAGENKIMEEVGKARNKADIVVVSFHWGVEYTQLPTKRQQDLARLAIDSGSDLVIGNHPHWIQPVEIYKKGLIVYAHGNFIFDQMWSEKTREGVLGRYTFYDNKLIDVEFLPIFIKDYGQPYFIESEGKKKVLEEMKEISMRLSL